MKQIIRKKAESLVGVPVLILSLDGVSQLQFTPATFEATAQEVGLRGVVEEMSALGFLVRIKSDEEPEGILHFASSMSFRVLRENR